MGTERKSSFTDHLRGAGQVVQALWLVLQMVGGAAISVCRAAVAAAHIRLMRLIRGK